MKIITHLVHKSGNYILPQILKKQNGTNDPTH